MTGRWKGPTDWREGDDTNETGNNRGWGFSLLDRLNTLENVFQWMEDFLQGVKSVSDWTAMCYVEARAGKEYWRAWKGVLIWLSAED